MKSALPLLLGVGAVAVLASRKKKTKSRPSDYVFEAEDIIGMQELGMSDVPKIGPREVGFSADLSQYRIGGTWRINILDAWLEKRRRAGKLATVDHNAGYLYRLFIDDPTTFLGDITKTGKTGGTIIYGALWLMATVGVGIYAAGAGSFTLGQAAHFAGARTLWSTRTFQMLGHQVARTRVGIATAQRAGAGNVSHLLKTVADYGGKEWLTRFGVGKATAGLSTGAVAAGGGMAAHVLREMGMNEAFAPDIAASAVENAAEFMATHSVNAGGVQIPISLLPSSDAYPKVQEFNKIIIGYILGFQKRHFED